MFSPLKIEFDLTEEMNGSLLEKVTTSNKKSKAKIHIPTLMQNISAGTPKISIENSKGLSIFSNIEGRPNISKALINSQNYLESPIYGNIDSDNVENAINKVTQNITRWVSSEVASSGTVKLSYTLKKGSSVRCKFLNGKISKLSYSVNSTGQSPITSI